MEDARFTRFTGDDGTAEYRATYTGIIDGRRSTRACSFSSTWGITPMLIGWPGRPPGTRAWRCFPGSCTDTTSPCARSDGESKSLASSRRYVWDKPVGLQEPPPPWEMLQRQLRAAD